MVSPVKDISSAARSVQDSAESTLADLRDQVTQLAKEVSSIAERRTRAIARNGCRYGRSRRFGAAPYHSPSAGHRHGGSGGAGAVLALLVMPRFSRPSSPASRWDSWTPNITRADLHDFADNISRSVSRAAHSGTASITPAFERLVDALSRVDTGSSMSSLVDKASGWFQKAQDKAKEKLG